MVDEPPGMAGIDVEGSVSCDEEPYFPLFTGAPVTGGANT